jgi:GDSL-like Lipase/Acylhydrolase
VRWIHRVLLGVVILLAVVIGGPREAAAFTNGAPDSMCALGDSIKQATNFDFLHIGSNPAYSWATGDNSAVRSLYWRILQGNPNINLKNFNYSVNGAKMTNLNSQAVNLDGTPGGVELVTIEMGGNDVCTSTEATMTPVATYRSQFETATNTLTIGFPNRRIFVASVPDVYQLWAVLHTNEVARLTWSAFSICQSLLLNPLSMLPADVQRRDNVRQRNTDFNTQLADVCACTRSAPSTTMPSSTISSPPPTCLTSTTSTRRSRARSTSLPVPGPSTTSTTTAGRAGRKARSEPTLSTTARITCRTTPGLPTTTTTASSTSRTSRL